MPKAPPLSLVLVLALVAARDGEVLGYCYATQFRDRAAYARTCEDSIYLAPGRTGQGLGTVLLAALVEARDPLRTRSDALGERWQALAEYDDAQGNLRREAQALKEVVADLTLENRLLKKSMTGGGGNEA